MPDDERTQEKAQDWKCRMLVPRHKDSLVIEKIADCTTASLLCTLKGTESTAGLRKASTQSCQ